MYADRKEDTLLNSMPLVEALQRHHQQQPVSFHVPGHKNGLLLPLSDSISFSDITELTGLDDLHVPDSCIEEAQTLLQQFYGAKASYFLVNGSTVGNMAMLLSTVSKGEPVFVQQNCHKSVLNALKIAGAVPVFLSPEWDEATKSAGGIAKETLKEALAAFPEGKTLMLTYPTYYGVAGEVESVIRTAKENGVTVLVDEAHGAHLKAIGASMKSAVDLDADLVVQSAHKMLPALTMGAYLHVMSDRANKEKIAFYLQALQSSSPSYPIMASLDWARAYASSFTKEDHFWSMAIKQRTVSLLEEKGFFCIETDDPYKLMVRAEGATGYDVQRQFEQAGLFPELADPYQVLLLFPLCKQSDNSFWEQFLQKIPALVLPKPHSLKEIARFTSVQSPQRFTTLAVSYEQQAVRQKKRFALRDSAGQVAAEMVIPYPPGIPLLMEGERVTKDHIDRIQWLLANGARFHGGSSLATEELIVFEEEE